jgi:hypothetical protein
LWSKPGTLKIQDRLGLIPIGEWVARRTAAAD